MNPYESRVFIHDSALLFSDHMQSDACLYRDLESLREEGVLSVTARSPQEICQGKKANDLSWLYLFHRLL